ncbi:hypothetical protein HDR63_04035 [bacterium]|nr:hypothetical protein [bacterium]
MLDTRDFYAYDTLNQSVQKTHRVDMLTRSARRVIRDVTDTAAVVGFWARRGDTVLVDARDNIVTNLRHQRMQKHLIKSR